MKKVVKKPAKIKDRKKYSSLNEAQKENIKTNNNIMIMIIKKEKKK